MISSRNHIIGSCMLHMPLSVQVVMPTQYHGSLGSDMHPKEMSWIPINVAWIPMYAYMSIYYYMNHKLVL